MLFPLYNAARHAFMTALKQRKVLLDPPRKIVDEVAIDSISISEDFLESEVMKHSKVLLLLSCDFGTAWNSRKLVVLKKRKLSLFMEELLLSAIILSYSAKSEHAWSHRRWVIKTIDITNKDLQAIVGRESELVEKIAEKSKMNYRAWNHRCWLVAYMTREQVLDELSKLRKWAELHVADNCCFHYRRRLMHRVLESSCSKQDSNAYHVWKEELDWNEMLIRRYVGREALWVHRRFLSQLATTHFAIDVEGGPCHSGEPCHSGDQGHVKHEISIFINNELLLLRSCLAVPDNDFEDNRAQVVHAASYILWLSKQIPEPTVIEIQEKLRDLNLKTVLLTLCQEKALLWEGLMG